jgi:hypothetical protein
MIGDLRVHARSRMVSRLAASLAAGRPVVLAVIAYAPCQNRHLSFAEITNQTYPVEQVATARLTLADHEPRRLACSGQVVRSGCAAPAEPP